MKKILVGLAVLCLAAACTQPEPPAGEGGTVRQDARTRTQKDRLTIAVIPKGLVHQFWLTVHSGAEEAGRDLGAAILWRGPEAETEVMKQIDIIDDMITRGVDGIVLAACDTNALIDPVKRAVDAGIPVVTIDSGVESDLPVSFVATDNLKGAQMAADKLAELIGGKGVVGQIPFVPGAATSQLREKGFLDGMAKHPEITVLPPQYSMSDVAKGMSVTQDLMTAHPEMVGIFGANESSAMGAVQAIEAAGKKGQIKLVAFDAAQEELDALERGTIQALIVQNPFQMGYQGVKAVIDKIKGKDVPKQIDTGVTVITAENLESPEVRKLLNPMAPPAETPAAAPAEPAQTQ
ncbi:MAG: ABC transporter substrate-binding protein [FCB group bacterium]|jgi:ribose transport system substrate-binding protein|nr:ABC transporter substrate-binding protein [FCB group bacterium]